MAAKYTDKEIASFLAERKPLAADFMQSIRLRERRGHKEQELRIARPEGGEFRLILRQSAQDPLDFSIIVGLLPAGSNQLFRLRRYNGRSHEHTNRIEGDRFYDFHIHTATERYQELGMREDAYAEPSDRFSDLNSALRCMLEDCAFDMPRNPQRTLFEEAGR